MIKIIYFAYALSEIHDMELETWAQCLDKAEDIHRVQPSYTVLCCVVGERCEEVEFVEGVE